MANVVGSGKARTLVDADGDAVVVSSTGRLAVDLSAADRGVGSAMVSYTQFDAIDGTAVNLEDSTNGIDAATEDCLEIILQADYDNTGYVMVGSSGVVGDTKGIRLNSGDILVLPVSDTATVFTRGSAASQKVNVSIIRQ